MTKKTFRKLEVLLHFLTAFVLLIKGCDEMNRRLYFPGGIILSFTVIIFIITIFWKTLYISPKQARQICYYLESPALLIISYMLHLEGKMFLPDLFLIAAIIYPVMGYISSKKFRHIKDNFL
ncbi:hypothetical protein [Flavobacterium sp. NRK1]|uniref:hypothetical protein n=1 Tax=Flavobacterium sp. NRK1 TaxID=2954929 RepID=UPI0020929A8C|nr:hypothetical protein [Flavobacterium sp. NRK1]MCO6148393.1 hypothetical protein [Flavobacterium sp. NRK1]